MTRVSPWFSDEVEVDVQVDYRRAAPAPNQQRRRSEHVRRRRPTGYNGIHRRRNKRWTW